MRRQSARAVKLAEQHPDQVRLAFDLPFIPVGVVLFHKPIEDRPRNLLQKAMKNDILVPHGVDPLRVQLIRNHLN